MIKPLWFLVGRAALALLGFNVAVCAQSVSAEYGGGAAGAAVLYGKTGRFEVIAYAGTEGRRMEELAAEAWVGWRDALALPDRFPTGITVRLLPEAEWVLGDSAWRVVGESGGVVTLWVKAGGAGVARDRRWLMALAHGAWYRQGIALGVIPEKIWIPDWLVAGAAELVLSGGERVALQDSWRRKMVLAERIPALITVLSWQGGVQNAAESGDMRVATAFGVWQWLRAESRGTPDWRKFAAALLRGQAPRPALNVAYGQRFDRLSGSELELAWQAAAAGLARTQGGPLLSAQESRAGLAQMDRLVLVDARDGREHAVRLSEVWAERNEAAVAVARDRRAAVLAADFNRVHPFYRNASGSLGRVWLAQRAGRQKEWQAALAEWRADLALGEELERASAALLDGPGR